jgi:hypothetical protein
MKRLAANAAQLDIFGSAFVVRQKDGWQITYAGRQFLTKLEATIQATPRREQRPQDDAGVVPLKALPKLRLVVDNTRAVSSSVDANKLSA